MHGHQDTMCSDANSGIVRSVFSDEMKVDDGIHCKCTSTFLFLAPMRKLHLDLGFFGAFDFEAPLPWSVEGGGRLPATVGWLIPT